jgi:rhodanese-related sulfurtransferase
VSEESPEQVYRTTAEELRARREAGADVVVVDVRPPPLFQEHRIPGAISIPRDELDQRSSVLDARQAIVFY